MGGTVLRLHAIEQGHFIKCWKRSGVSAALEEPQQKEDPFEL